MSTRNTLWLLWLPGALFMFTSAAMLRADYEDTPVEDPLQPVWDKLDTLSADILQGFKTHIDNKLREMQTGIEEKIRAVTAKVDLKTSSVNNNLMNNLGQVDNKMTALNNSLSAWLESFYTERIQTDADQRLNKLEQHIDVRTSALENKINTLVRSFGGQVNCSPGSNATPAGSVTPEADSTPLPSGSTADMERRIASQVTTVVNSMEAGMRNQLTGLSQNIATSRDILDNVNTHLTKINEKLSTEGDEGEGASPQGICRTLEDKVSELLNDAGSQRGSQGEGACSCLTQEVVDSITSALTRIQQSPAFLPRDCSDIHWQSPEAPSGVFQTYPNMDPKSPAAAWCDMGDADSTKDLGGWTVILRRRNSNFGHIEFNRTWGDYRAGFGDPAEGEWWYGLASIHALTYRQPYQARFILHDVDDGWFYAEYSTFRVEDELNKFRLIVGDFSGNLTVDALSSKHHESPFSTWDQDNDEWGSGNCAVSNSGGWWFNACHYTTLTAPFPTSNNRSAKTIRWQNGDRWLVLDDVTVQIRPANYAERFNAQD